MYDPNAVRPYLIQLREEAGLPQSGLAKRLGCAPSRVCRIESGELSTSLDDAVEIAQAINTGQAVDFATYLGQEWHVLPKPGFNHPNRTALWTAETALQKLNEMLSDPDLKNIFVRQIESCRAALEKAAAFLISTDHPIVFIGSPGVGKTTAICTVGDLRDPSGKTLNQQMALQTGSGRVTVCEVQIRRGGSYSISIEPCSNEELRQYVAEFCDFLIQCSNSTDSNGSEGKQGAGISSEIERVLRNMSGLTQKRVRAEDGKLQTEDIGIALVETLKASGSDYGQIREQLFLQVFSRLNIAVRDKTSKVYPRTSSESGMTWLSNTFRAINMGRHPEFTIPRRIEISVPNAILSAENMDLSLVDSRGVDEPKAPRQDIQAHFDNERAVIVLCSNFKDAPSAAIQEIIERTIDGGLRDTLLNRSVLLVLPQDREEANVSDALTGEPVETVDEGRIVREYQARSTTLSDLGVRSIKMLFLDVATPDDGGNAKNRILDMVMGLRQNMEAQIGQLVTTASHLVDNKENAEVQAIFEQVTRRLAVWVREHRLLPEPTSLPGDALLEDIDELRYASTLRATVSRYGDWYKFPYWHGIGYGMRCELESRNSKACDGLLAIIENLLNDPEFEPAHGYILHFLQVFKTLNKDFLVNVQELGTTAFTANLKAKTSYWHDSQERWGEGPGYKKDIRTFTKRVLSEPDIDARNKAVEAEVKRLWLTLLNRLEERLSVTADQPKTT